MVSNPMIPKLATQPTTTHTTNQDDARRPLTSVPMASEYAPRGDGFGMDIALSA